jgi:hypothetical protein
MHERERYPSPDFLDEAEEMPGHITDVLGMVKGHFRNSVNERFPDFGYDAEGLGELFAHDFLSLISPSALEVELKREQRVFLRMALCDAVDFRRYPDAGPDIDRNKVLGVATYINSLARLATP